ncbi:NUDIX hydrolase [Microvirga terrae]|uniref:NUDIX hydrolase n=1 Tax=Microvirga terrae TaxID=2740529 RepID=A0ABY5RRB7_9HYPH|nr:NUDIX hydrolase [Microvirga terrae]UVF18859.1 NUDIX hydrolase [Microvirga terrae]
MGAEVVVAVVMRPDGRVLMIRRKRAVGNLRWSFPGGKINSFETEQAASEREVKEEAGIECAAFHKIGQWYHPDVKKEISYWLCSHLSGEPVVSEPHLIDRVGWFTKSQVEERVTTTIFPPLAAELGISPRAQLQLES